MDAPRATFTDMRSSTRDDWQVIAAEAKAYNRGLAARVADHLRLLDGDFGGFAVDRLTHSLQTATRAARDGRDDEYVACALLHDIGDTLGSFNHPAIAAAIVEPFVEPRNHWIVAHHGYFQGYYYFHHVGLDRDVRDRFAGHPHYDACAEFCELYDQASFDPSYPTMPLEEFTPLLEAFFRRPRRSLYRPARPAEGEAAAQAAGSAPTPRPDDEEP
ncbi:MAG: HD domain-containing protein [Acidimicrobiia bacterium]